MHLLEWNPQGQQKRGRPKNTWGRVLIFNLKEIGKTLRDT